MKKTINYKNLIINPQNYRFDPVENQEEAIDLMIKEKGKEMFNLAKHIAQKGLDGGKNVRVVSLGKQYLILDGNRRITAIKSLHNPDLIKDQELKGKFLNLLKEKINIVQNIDCFVYDNEEDALEWIGLDHTGKNDGIGQDKWDYAAQERFKNKVSGNLSPALQCVDFVQDSLNKKINTKDLKISTVNRIISNPLARSYLGIDIKAGKIVCTCDENEAVSRIDKLFDKILLEGVNVSEVYTTIKINDFMEEIFETIPNSSFQKPLLSSPVDTKKKKTFKQSDWISNKDYKEYLEENKIKIMLKEMCLLDPKKNSCVLMPAVRILLELSLYNKLEVKGYIGKIISDYNNSVSEKNLVRIKDNKPVIEIRKDWSPSFQIMLNYIVDEGNKVISDPQSRVFLNKFIKKEGSSFVKDLNMSIHNIHEIPDENDPENFWRKYGRSIFNIINEKIK